MNLDSMIVERKYRVKLTPSEAFSKVEAFLFRPALEGIPESVKWICIEDEKTDRYAQYDQNPEWIFIHHRTKSLDLKKPVYQMFEVEKHRKQFYKDLDKGISEVYRLTSPDVPDRLRVLVYDVDESGCTCKAECTPTLFQKVRRGTVSLDRVAKPSVMQACHECASFLDQVFIGHLGADPIEEVFIERPQLELLVNDSHVREIRVRIDSMLNEAMGEVMICGWIGTKYLPKLMELAGEGVNIRFITHKSDDAKGQPWSKEIDKANQEIHRQIGKDKIRYDYSMHGRTVIVDNKALIGSMDLNSYSLDGPHTEFAIYTEQPEVVRRLRRLFETKFRSLGSS